ncbi:PD-(D/E)XK nuclease family protein [Reichenbachiella agarivorans]|uniref:PD-(D/E)XK nuclease family protein n=1 Tax=Reichenbachiella agarivorans TaxID=2979464 RepID=A0ABY6CKZ8_9BACT|nr:PD-(D/E)XK nuclease family protein [Reichenbachiella agarivorans]UXP31190.1 PD-(D/E)XK nuclease family protein [Reichenbachiella agarivorans]
MNHSNFLESLAARCKEQFEENCGQLHIIFPNKRAGLYFATYLAELYEKPVWSPIITSFESFVEEQQDRKLADELQLSFVLYKAYKSLLPHAEAFDAFLPWGEMILKDFNDIDNYLVETNHIFRVIKSQKELDDSFDFLSEDDKKIIQGFWQGFLPEPDKKQTEFIKTWSILDQLYERFNTLLQEQNLVYKGRLFREFSDNCDSLVGKQVWFAGFNALTRAEEKIIKRCLDGGQSDIFWEIDSYYFEGEYQESGLFFREYAKDPAFKASIERDIQSQINHKNKQIELVSAPLRMGQIMATCQQLEQLSLSAGGIKDTLVILADESYLPNLLDKLPPSVGAVNVTMGWGIGHARFYILLQKLIELQYSLSKNKGRQLKFKELQSILSFNDLLAISDDDVETFIKHCLAENRYLFQLEDFEEEFPHLVELIQPKEVSGDYLDALVDFIQAMDLEMLGALDKSVAITLHSTFKRLASASADQQIELSMASLLRLYKKLGNTIKLPFTGEPNSNLQVMGILETRNLSFKNVLIVGMNEGSWPKDSSTSSFIPYNIRKAFDLPTTEHQDAMQAYLFYRLLHNTESMWITYNNITEFNKNGELSRYVQQLQYESEIQFVESSVETKVLAEPVFHITKQKNGETLTQLRRYLVGSENPRRLSPSALNTYIDCKLKFYFNYIEEIYEPDEIKEDIDPSLLGNLLHTSMEFLYEGKKELTEEVMKELVGQIESAVNRSFVENKLEIDQVKKARGRQLIVYEVIKQFVSYILKADTRYTPFEVIALESKDYTVDFEIETLEGTEKVGLKGVIDRVDRKNEHIRIVDYKSGRDNREFSDIAQLIDVDAGDNRNKGVFQLLYYSMLYKDNHPGLTLPIQPLMYNSKDLHQPDFDGQLKQKGNKEAGRTAGVLTDYSMVEDEFKETLTYLLTEIFNTSIDFTQTEDLRKCQYCPYIEICRRG